MFKIFNLFKKKMPSEYLISRHLVNCSFEFKKYKQISAGWDHDHCEFCAAKFMVTDKEEVLEEGWVSLKNDHWICSKCFEENKEVYQFKIMNAEG